MHLSEHSTDSIEYDLWRIRKELPSLGLEMVETRDYRAHWRQMSYTHIWHVQHSI